MCPGISFDETCMSCNDKAWLSLDKKDCDELLVDMDENDFLYLETSSISSNIDTDFIEEEEATADVTLVHFVQQHTVNSRVDSSKHFFAGRIVQPWNSLPAKNEHFKS